MASTTTPEEPVPSELYGPYPRAIPVPTIGKDGSTPTTNQIKEAKTMFDLPPDHRDKGTPDEWVPRDGRLVRLTGRHPFNVEPPISVLNKHKFITPSSMHYVRNHGAVPKLTWDTHTVSVGGPLVASNLSLSMDDLASMTPRELPVTLVCAGNRRKEQNMIRQTIGFNWGPSGVSTNVYKGVLLRDILLQAGVSEKSMRGKHVEFIGYEDLPNKVGPGPFPEEPWGKQVKYGTSIPLARAMNPAYDVLVAYEANGEKLQPDHGFPVRLVIPGYIGGRMIKWLSAINVIPYETKNHYHYHDNRILPPHITAEESLTGKWWYKPEYIFNELNINSAVAKPDHNEMLGVRQWVGKEYEMAGYAYTGGGRKITRVEVSWDEGINWQLADVNQKEQPTDHGMYWCWVWWTFKIDASEFVGAKEIWCRAWDEGNNCQPNNPTWNLMGMGNNQVFRIKIHVGRNTRGEAVFRFEHPTQPGQLPGGWMHKIADKPESAGFGKLLEMEGEVIAVPEPVKKVTKEGGTKLITWDEIRTHDTDHDVWIVVNDRVYDCTEYLELHPGGEDSILINGGADSTEDFNAIHSTKAHKMLERYYIGDVDKSSVPEEAEEKKEETDGVKIALNPKKKEAFKLQNKVVLSHDSFMLDFALQSPEHVLGLPTGKHVFLSAMVKGELVMRRYTPISSNYDVGCIKFVLKAYYPNKRFPNGGKLSQHLDALKIGDTMDIRGPVGEFEYLSNGNFTIDGEAQHASRFNCIAGGTGITPVLQVMAEILRNPNDPTLCSLIFACREENDLLMRSTLDEWVKKFPKRFQVEYILSDSWPAGWKYSTGFVSKKLFEDHLYPATNSTWNLMCGPPIMLEKGCNPAFIALGHEKAKIFSF